MSTRCILHVLIVLSLALTIDAAEEKPEDERALASRDACDPELHCYDPKDSFSYVPLKTFYPQSREKIGTTFVLYTRNSPKDADGQYTGNRLARDDTILNDSGFQDGLPVKFIVHGFLDKVSKPWIKKLTKALLDSINANVITVDWRGGNLFPYSQAAVNTWTVGGEIYLLSKYLVDKQKVTFSNIHIIGHSLGSHVAGHAGARTNGQLGRISALDPAGPLFYHKIDNVIDTYFPLLPKFRNVQIDTSLRLDPTDAQFIDVIHTDGGLIGFGYPFNLGHIDVYPNKGRYQKGCSGSIIEYFISGNYTRALEYITACSHMRSIDMYIESLDSSSKCSFIAHKCDSYDSYNAGQCSSCGTDGKSCVKMGYHAIDYPNPTGQDHFFIKTALQEPFCAFHYKVSAVLSETPYWCGIMSITIVTDKGSNAFTIEIPERQTRTVFTTLIGHNAEFTSVPRALFQWSYQRCRIISVWVPVVTKNMAIQKIVIEPIDVSPQPASGANRQTVCMSGNGKAKDSTVYELKKDYCRE